MPATPRIIFDNFQGRRAFKRIIAFRIEPKRAPFLTRKAWKSAYSCFQCMQYVWNLSIYNYEVAQTSNPHSRLMILANSHRWRDVRATQWTWIFFRYSTENIVLKRDAVRLGGEASSPKWVKNRDISLGPKRAATIFVLPWQYGQTSTSSLKHRLRSLAQGIRLGLRGLSESWGFTSSEASIGGCGRAVTFGVTQCHSKRRPAAP